MPTGSHTKWIEVFCSSMTWAARICALMLVIPSFAQASDTERLNAEIPEGWIPILHSNTGNLRLVEYVPENSPAQWQQKISIEAMSGAGLPDPLTFVEGWAADQAGLCDDFLDNAIFAGFENGYATVVRLLECGKNKRTGKPLITMVKVIKGNKSLYTTTRIWRLEPAGEGEGAGAGAGVGKGDGKGKELPISRAELGAWSNTLSRMTACDPALDAHRCPAKTDRPETP